MLLRRFALPPDRIGEILAIAFLVSGVLGSVPGGVLADLCQRKRGPRGTMTVLSGISLLSVPAALFALVPGIAAASILFILFITLANSISVMGTTLFIVVMPNELRGLSVGILTAACVLIGTGLAPMMVSELAQMMGGPIRVGEALSYLCVATSLVAAGAFVLGRRFVPLIPDVAAPWATEATDP
jgi:MFS family permease